MTRRHLALCALLAASCATADAAPRRYLLRNCGREEAICRPLSGGPRIVVPARHRRWWACPSVLVEQPVRCVGTGTSVRSAP